MRAKIMTPPIEQPAAMPSIAAADKPPPDEELVYEPEPLVLAAAGSPDRDAGPSETNPELARTAVEAPPTVLPIAVI